MKKLFNLKEFLTLQEASRHLAIVFGEEVCEADILRLALDGHLKLSVNFVNGAKAHAGKVVPFEDAHYREFLPEMFPKASLPDGFKDKPVMVMTGINLDGKRVLELDDAVVRLTGLYDLVLLGNERQDVEHQYQMLTGGPSVTLHCLQGAFVVDDTDTMYQLLESYDNNELASGSSASLRALEERIKQDKVPRRKAEGLLNKHKEDREKFLTKVKQRTDKGRDAANYYPAGGLSEDCVMVVRTQALRSFEESINTPVAQDNKPIATNERNTLLTLIAALCKHTRIKPEDRGAATKLAGMTDDIGASITDDTIRKILLKIPDALESRMK